MILVMVIKLYISCSFIIMLILRFMAQVGPRRGSYFIYERIDMYNNCYVEEDNYYLEKDI